MNINNKGITTLEVLGWIVSFSVGAVVWAYSTFTSKETTQMIHDSSDKEMNRMQSDISEIKGDVKELLKRGR